MNASAGLYVDGDIYSMRVRYADVVEGVDETPSGRFATVRLNIVATLKKKGEEHEYEVRQFGRDAFSCGCKAYTYRKARRDQASACKHIQALRAVGIFVS